MYKEPFSFSLQLGFGVKSSLFGAETEGLTGGNGDFVLAEKTCEGSSCDSVAQERLPLMLALATHTHTAQHLLLKVQ